MTMTTETSTKLCPCGKPAHPVYIAHAHRTCSCGQCIDCHNSSACDWSVVGSTGLVWAREVLGVGPEHSMYGHPAERQYLRDRLGVTPSGITYAERAELQRTISDPALRARLMAWDMSPRRLADLERGR